MFITAAGAAKCKLHSELYVAGLPCIRFSVRGGRGSEPDRDSSIFELSLIYIETPRPTAFVLENDLGILTIDDGACFK